MSKPRIAVVFGSDSDWEVMEKCVGQLREFKEEPHVEIMSAHRDPRRVLQFASTAKENGFEVIIAAAGLSAALAGTVASHTPLPVIGVPLSSGDLHGIDALLSTLQMPPGVPVGCVGLGSAGARNAALLAIQILALKDANLATAYEAFRAEQRSAVEAKNRSLQGKLGR